MVSDTSSDARAEVDAPGEEGPPAIVIAPSNAIVPASGERSFGCTVTGLADTGCSFSVEEASGGTIDASGLYRAPAEGGTYHVTATSSAEPTLTARATITVPAVARACDALAPPGTWENITPPAVLSGLASSENIVFSFAVDPINAGTVYLGTTFLGVWKTTDCGATWVHLDTGRNAGPINTGMNWTFVVDSENPERVYTSAGYGSGSNGIFRSDNGGVDWDVVWPPADPELSGAFASNFANQLTVDPLDHRHMLLTFHERCYRDESVCIAETEDGGDTWRLIVGDPSWRADGEGVKAHFLEDGDSWIWMSQVDGLWLTDDGGASFRQISTQGANHLQSTQIVRAGDGTFIIAGLGDLFRTPLRGRAGDWLVPGTGPLPGGVVSDGTTIYMSRCYYGDFCNGDEPFYFTAPAADPSTWTPMESPPLSVMDSGGVLGFDRTHRVLYSSNLRSGFWRVVTE